MVDRIGLWKPGVMSYFTVVRMLKPHAPRALIDRASHPLLACAVLLVYSGCIHEPTRAERAASFAQHEHSSIAGEPLAKFLFDRTARVLSVSSVPPGRISGDNGILGTAAMIDPAGYFLTAAHCLASEDVVLVFEHVGHEFKAPARIVWRGYPEQGGADLALLHASGLPIKSFHWAPHMPVRSSPVVAVGQNTTETGAVITTSIGGHYLGGSPARFPGVSGMWVNHSTPLRGGDSGGPLVSTNGELIGINVHSKSVLPLLPPALRGGSVALRPDPAWISRLILDDTRQGSTASHPVALPDS
ncbi:MAG TPA: serine protease [Opitutaceae bacterium]